MPSPAYRLIACRHCGWERPEHGRGLCSPCYRDISIRQQYPRGTRWNPSTPDDDGEPTAEEIEAMVAAQLESLPSWWACEVEAMRQQAEAERLEWFVVKLMNRAPRRLE